MNASSRTATYAIPRSNFRRPMMRRSLYSATYSTLLTIYVLGMIGCVKHGDSTSTARHVHAHAAEGPHGGHIIELGSETHHAELTHDDESHRIGVYLLDGSAKAAAPIDAESVTINVTQDGKLTPYVLPAAPQPDDGDGKTSYFELDSEPLCAVICGESEAESTRARITITIDGKPFVGIIETESHDHHHHHDHAH
jgi:hypothetical protein